MWANEYQLILRPRTNGEEKYESQAIPALLASLRLRGCLVATDTLNCRAETTQMILAQQANYLLALKENYASLYEAVALLFDEVTKDAAAHAQANPCYDYATQVDKVQDGY